jgi:alpha-D-xyloside xylohydrolase
MMGCKKEGNALSWKMNNEIIWIQPWGKDSLRMRITRGQKILDLPGGLLDVIDPEPQIKIGENGAFISNGVITAEISREGHLRFINNVTEEVLLEEVPAIFTEPSAREFKSLRGDLYKVEARFCAYEDEHIYGLGQHAHGFLDQKGCVIELSQRNTNVCIPFAISSRGYGFLWHNPAVGRVEFAKNRTHWVAEATRQMDYWVTAGESVSNLMENYTQVTGRVPMLPKWAAGFWQCKLRYSTQDELLEVAREYKSRKLPLSVIVIDSGHSIRMGDWKFDEKYWPDPKAMVDELESMGVKVMVSIWPTVNVNSPNYDVLEKRGLLIQAERGVPAIGYSTVSLGDGRVYFHHYDPTNPEARQFIWEQVRENYYHFGIKVWWLDALEPEIVPIDHDNLHYFLGNGLEIGCMVPMLHEKAFFDGMRSENEEDIITLCRSAWVGSQRYGAAVWSGDIPSTFEALRAQIPAGLNIGLSGIPWWTTDIGGFYGGDPSSPYFRELIIRWFQYGVFCPLFRLHGFRIPEIWIPDSHIMMTGAPNEIWSFGDEAYNIIRDLLFLRERLRPYIMEQMEVAHRNGTPPMRPLFYDFPEDGICARIEDQFLFGPDILVAPVLHEGARSRDVYLPAGANWTHVWSDQEFSGGSWITTQAPLSQVPVYVRGNKTLPFLVKKTESE